MRRFALFLALLTTPVLADEKAKPNTLTPKEIAEGWILLFDGETTFGWEITGKSRVKDGVLHLDGRTGSVVAEVSTVLGAYELRLECSEDGATWGAETVVVNGQGKRTSDGGVVSKELNRQLPITSVNAHDYRPAFLVSEGNSLYLRSIRCRPAGMKSLFNGKDLTGWKLYDPAKARAADPKAKDVKVRSRYTVTKEGWLNVKDGPGDLQTEGQWADFVLQLECISNGRHLNSGLFFRCIPGLYQQGYEAQIRNQWEADDRTKPVDFGTGAIYRRQPARKVVSTDGEWFTMTVAAHGRHFATWVNGYQVVDWTDDRKESDNARQGFKKTKGAISIQGHDPTTDLSFRNIRIQSLDSK